MGSELARRWQRDGFARVAPLASAADIAAFAQLLDGLFDRIDQLDPHQVHRLDRGPGEAASLEILETVRLEPRLAGTAVFAACERLSAELLDGAAELFFDHAIRKPAAVGSGTAWHQDVIYDRYEPHRGRVHFWIPTTAVGPAGGCMEFVPASHRRPLVRHEPSPADPSGHAWRVPMVDEATAEAVPVALGEATIHHQLTLHRTGPNHGAAARTAWILQFARPRTRREQLLESSRRARRLARRLVTSRR